MTSLLVIVLLRPAPATPRTGTALLPPPRQADGRAPQRPVFGARVELALVGVTVVDGNGVPIANLRPQDFRIRADGEEVEAAVVLTPSGSPLDVALVADLSSSMEHRTWRRDALAFLSALSPDRDCVYLLAFSTVVGGSIWGRPDNQALVTSLEDTQVIGGTALYDALLAAIAELTPRQPTVEATVAFPSLEQEGAADERPSAGGGAAPARRAPAAGRTRIPTRDVTAAGTVAAPRTSDEPRSSAAPHTGFAPRRTGCPAPFDLAAGSDPTKTRRRVVVVVTDGQDTRSSKDIGGVLLASHFAGVPIFHVTPPPVIRRRGMPRSFSPEDSRRA